MQYYPNKKERPRASPSVINKPAINNVSAFPLSYQSFKIVIILFSVYVPSRIGFELVT